MKRLLSAICLSTLLTAGCATTQPGGGIGDTADVKVEPNRVCYSIGKGYKVIQPAVFVVEGSPVVPDDVKLRFKQGNDSVITAFDACVTAAAVAEKEDVDKQLLKASLATQELTALILSFKASAPDATKPKPTDAEITQLVTQLVFAGILGGFDARDMSVRLKDATPVSDAELEALRVALSRPVVPVVQ